MSLTRRSALASFASLAASTMLPAKSYPFQLGVTDWNLRLTGKIEAVGLASRIGFAGVQVSLGRKAADNKLPLDNDELIAQYKAEAKKQNIKLCGTCLDILHVNYLKNDKLGAKWVADSIGITKKLGVKVVLLPFFSRGALTTKAEMDYVGDVLRDIAPEAEKQGIILGLEDTISAEDNIRIVDRTKSKAVMTYYDIGNSTLQNFDVVKEIRWLGKKRICQLHLKDNPGYLGDGKIDMPLVLKTIKDIGYDGYAILETDSPSRNVEADMKRNYTYLLKLLNG